LNYSFKSIDNNIKYPINFNIINKHTLKGDVIKSIELTDKNTGTISLPAGYYLISVTGNNYQPTVEKIYLDSDESVSIELRPKDEVYRIYKEVDLTNPLSEDMDLNLKMKTAGGDECTVNYLNKKCPYAEYTSDIQLN